MTLETPHRLAMVSRLGGTDERKQKSIWIASLLVKRELVLKMFVLGVVQGRCAGGWDPTSLRAPMRSRAELRRATAGRSIGGERIYGLGLDAEWVWEE